MLGPLLFYDYKLNEIKNTFLLVGYKIMPEMHLRKPGFTYIACGPFTKHKERIKIQRNKRLKIYLSKRIR